MTAAESARYSDVVASAANADVKIVSMAGIWSSAASDGTLTFQIPGRTDTLRAAPDLVTDDAATGLTWSGHFTNKFT